MNHILPMLPPQSMLQWADSTTTNRICFTTRCHNINLKLIQFNKVYFRTNHNWIETNSFLFQKKKNVDIQIRTSTAAFCRFDCEKLKVNASFHTGLRGSPDLPGLLFFFFCRFPFTIKYICMRNAANYHLNVNARMQMEIHRFEG